MTEPKASQVPHVMRRGLDALTAVLLVVVVVRAVTASGNAIAAVAMAVVFAAVYVAGRYAGLNRSDTHGSDASGSDSPSSGSRFLVWLVALEAAWLALLMCSPDGVWLAFPLLFLQASAMRRLWGYLLAIVTVVGSVVASALWANGWTIGGVVGPVIGAAVAVGIVKIVESLSAESERRQRLLDELQATQSELSVAERAAGAAGERERLAREIHDTLAQGFSSIQLLTRAVSGALERGETATAQGYVDQIDRAARDNLEEARRFVWELASPQLEGSGLAEALVRLGKQVSDQSGVKVSVDVYGDMPPLSPAVDFALLRIAQSAIANAVEHAETGRIVVTLNDMEDVVRLDVVDQGVGFDPAALQASGHQTTAMPHGFGLASMRARAEAVGAKLTIESSPGAGAAIAVEVQVSRGDHK